MTAIFKLEMLIVDCVYIVRPVSKNKMIFTFKEIYLLNSITYVDKPKLFVKTLGRYTKRNEKDQVNN